MAKRRLKKQVKRNMQIIAVLFGLVTCIVLLVCTMFPKKVYATKGIIMGNVGEIEVIEMIIPEGSQNRPGILREIHYIVVHETDNFFSSSDADHHARYLYENLTDINSWHYTVDDHSIYHQLPDEEVGWHAGDKQTENGGNMTGIGIEMCVNEGNDFEKTKDITAQLIAKLLKAYDLDIDAVKKHQHFSGKNCPAHLLDEKSWDEFIELIKKYL